MSIGTRLREERERLGMTQRQLADRVGLKVRTLQGWEGRKGKTPRDPGTLLALARFLGVPAAELLAEAAGAHAPALKGRPREKSSGKSGKG